LVTPSPALVPERTRFAAPVAIPDELTPVATQLDTPEALAPEPDRAPEPTFAAPVARPQEPTVVATEVDPVAPADVPTFTVAAAQVPGPFDAASPSGVRGLLVPVLAALLVVLVGLTGYLGYKADTTAGAPSVEGSRNQALAAARDAARAVFSYDYRELTKDFDAGKAVSTGTFAEQYAGTTSKLLDFAVKNKAVVAADISDASVVRAHEDEVVCLVFLNQTSTSAAVTAPRITQSRLEMTMKRRGQSWLVASINAL
jgi:Mce-associated membrane protein